MCKYSCLFAIKKTWKVGSGKNISIVGIGGLGHLTIKISKALGAYITVYTTSQAKADDAKRLGADNVDLSTDTEQMKNNSKQDMILDTVSSKYDINSYISLLKTNGLLVMMGLPAEQLEISAFNIVHRRKSFSGSNIEGIAETQEVLNFCAKHNVPNRHQTFFIIFIKA